MHTLPALPPESSALQATASEISNLHAEILQAAHTTLDKAIRIGELLAGIKSQLKHGQWLPWIKANLPFAERTARNYVRCFSERDRLKSASVADLGAAYRLLSEGDPDFVIDVDDPRFEEQFEDASSKSMVRFAEMKSRLEAKDITLIECSGMVREALRLQNFWARVNIDCQRKMGEILNRAEAGGYKKELLREFNRLLREEAAEAAT